MYRYIAICHPMRAQATNTVRRARRITLCLWTAGILYCSPWLILSTTMPKRLDDGRSISTCTFTLPRGHYLVYYMADLIIFYAVPLLTATVLYGLIARTLYAAASGPPTTSSTWESGRASARGRDGIGVGGGAAARRRSTFLRQQSSISMSSANASNSRIQVFRKKGIAFLCNLSYGASPAVWNHRSHSVTCHPKQVNAT